MSKGQEKSRRALGRGISALLPQKQQTVAPRGDTAPAPESPRQLPVERIDANPLQPRTTFSAEGLQELSQSIQANGIIQPLVVRKQGDRYQLVAGERRLRAAKQAGLRQVPVIVQDIPDDHLLEITLVENIQREDLNPIETALAFERLLNELNLTHEEVARRTGKDRTTITNLLRLLKLPPVVQSLLAEHRVAMGHARAILGVREEDLQIQLAEKTAAEGLSVRQVERLVQKMGAAHEPKMEEPAEQDPNVKAAVHSLEDALGTRVRIVEKSPQRGRIEIEYYSQDDLDRIYQLIVKETSGQ